MEPPLCVVSSWVIRVYTVHVWNTISGSSNLDNYFYHCLILISISNLKALFNLLLLLFIIYIVNLLVVRPRSCQVIYYFDTPTLGRRHQSFGRVNGSSYKLAIVAFCISIWSFSSPNITFILSNYYYMACKTKKVIFFSFLGDEASLKDIIKFEIFVSK